MAKYHEWITADGLITLRGWARDGLRDVDLCARMEISLTTLYEWKKKFPELADALKRGKAVVDIEVENALLRRALGYSYKEVTRELKKDPATGLLEMTVTKTVTKDVPPDVTAQIFWLKNRKPAEWRDRREGQTDDAEAVEAGVAILPAVELVEEAR